MNTKKRSLLSCVLDFRLSFESLDYSKSFCLSFGEASASFFEHSESFGGYFDSLVYAIDFDGCGVEIRKPNSFC